MIILRKGMLLKAVKQMHTYRYDPGSRLPGDADDFEEINIGDTVVLLNYSFKQVTAVTNTAVGQGHLADIYTLLKGDKIRYQAWYEHRKHKDGYFHKAWQVLVP